MGGTTAPDSRHENAHHFSSFYLTRSSVSAFGQRAVSESAAGRRLSRRQHGRGAGCPFESHHRRVQYGRWVFFAPKENKKAVSNPDLGREAPGPQPPPKNNPLAPADGWANQWGPKNNP